MATEPGRPLRVCLVAPVPPPYGGVANWTLLLTAHAARDGRVAIDVINTASRRRSADGRGFVDRILRQGIGMLGCAWQLRREIRTQAPDVVHVTTAGQLGLIRDLLLLSLARRHAVPTVIHLHFGRVPELADQEAPEWLLLTRVLQRASLVITLDEGTERTLHTNVPMLHVTRIPNPVDLGSFPPERTGGRRVIFLGWVTPTKGIEDLLVAWAAVRRADPDWELLVVGPFDPHHIAALTARAGTEGVSFTGEVPHEEALQLLADAAALVLPSHTEAFPYVVLEAMALAKPVVATRVGAIPAMLADGGGVLVEPHDPDALASALTTLIGDEHARRTMGAAGRRRVESLYSLPTVFDTLVTEWSTLAGREGDPS